MRGPEGAVEGGTMKKLRKLICLLVSHRWESRKVGHYADLIPHRECVRCSKRQIQNPRSGTWLNMDRYFFSGGGRDEDNTDQGGEDLSAAGRKDS